MLFDVVTTTGERCAIYGCKKQLLICRGQRDVGSEGGRGQNAHFICKPCLERW